MELDTTFKRNILALAVLTASVTLTGCLGSDSDDSDTTSGPTPDTAGYVTLDAASDSSQAAYLDLASGIPTTADQNWHVAYQKYVGFKTNGGVSGTGGVTACYTGNSATLYDDTGKPIQSAFEALTADNTLAAFEAVTSEADCDSTGLVSDSVVTQVSWYDYDFATHSMTAKSDQWILRSATKNAATDTYAYGRFGIKTLDTAAGIKVVLGVEQWNSTTASFDSEIVSPEITYGTEPVYYDLETNAIVTAADDWDLSFVTSDRDPQIRVNGGASGLGSAGIGVLQTASAAEVTDPANTAQVYKYFSDQAEGALSSPGGYGPLDYGVGGGHNMWPNYAVYLVKQNEQMYKMQVLSNNGQDGTLSSGNLYIRYKAL